MRFRVRSVVILTALVTASLIVACDEKEVPYVIDADEIARLVATDSRATELFDWQTIILPDPYTVPFDSGVYSDSLLRHGRWCQVFVNPDPDVKVDWGELGMVRQAYARVVDTLIFQTTRTYSQTVLIDTATRVVERWGFLLKLGDDAEDYAGWLLWGYRGVCKGTSVPPLAPAPPQVRVKLYDGSDFSGDLSMYLEEPPHDSIELTHYIRLDRMPEIVMGSRVVVETNRSSSSFAAYHLLSGRDTSGVFRHEMIRQDTINVDTLRAPFFSQNPPQYGLLHLQAMRSANGEHYLTWSIPFRYKR